MNFKKYFENLDPNISDNRDIVSEIIANGSWFKEPEYIQEYGC